jgi:U3 small nucleolar RNA-associated protein 11
MGGDGGNLRHVVHKRVHLERAQPAARKKFGHLEKHKDYVKRAKDFHRKEDTIKKLQRKAYFKNEDEFAHGMLTHAKGQSKKDKSLKKKATHLSSDELLLLDAQDGRYVGMREQVDKKAIAKRIERLHFLDADRPNKHVLFVDDDELAAAPASSSGAPGAARSGAKRKLSSFNVAAHLDTHESLLGRKANRPRLEQLEKAAFADPVDKSRETKEAYRELFHRQERAKKLRRVREALELRTDLRGKGKRIMTKAGDKDSCATYRWHYDRKK